MGAQPSCYQCGAGLYPCATCGDLGICLTCLPGAHLALVKTDDGGVGRRACQCDVGTYFDNSDLLNELPSHAGLVDPFRDPSLLSVINARRRTCLTCPLENACHTCDDASSCTSCVPNAAPSGAVCTCLAGYILVRNAAGWASCSLTIGGGASTPPPSTSGSSGSSEDTNNRNLAIGLGVGLGVGVPLLAGATILGLLKSGCCECCDVCTKLCKSCTCDGCDKFMNAKEIYGEVKDDFGELKEAKEKVQSALGGNPEAAAAGEMAGAAEGGSLAYDGPSYGASYGPSSLSTYTPGGSYSSY